MLAIVMARKTYKRQENVACFLYTKIPSIIAIVRRTFLSRRKGLSEASDEAPVLLELSSRRDGIIKMSVKVGDISDTVFCPFMCCV